MTAGEQGGAYTLGHSPDPDDAFMFFGMATGRIDMEGLRFEHILEDIETLNQRARREELDVTAVSYHAYPYIADRYLILRGGSSMGDDYGPLVVAREPMSPSQLAEAIVAVPGRLTSAFLALQLCVGRLPRAEVMPFDRILDAVAAGRAAAGLIIHEGQLTYSHHGLRVVIDLGHWWFERTGGLPLPLGCNVVRRAIGGERIAQISRILARSIRYSLDHRGAAVAHALAYARDMNMALADRFIGMYVNDLTVDLGARGRAGVERFLAEGRAAGLLAADARAEFAGAGPD